MKNDLLIAFDNTTTDLLATIAKFTPAQFNQVPFEGSWTAGQVAEHLAKAEGGLPKVLQGNTAPTTRVVDQNAALISNIFLDFTTKMKSPPFIVPSDGPHDKDAFYQQLKDNRAEIARLAKTVDLDLTYLDFPLPNLGTLTGVEWIVFLTVHSTRHIRQMNNIYAAITGEQA